MHETDLATGFLREQPPFDRLEEHALRYAASRLEGAYYRAETDILKSGPEAGLAVIRKGAVRLLDDRGRFLDQRCEGELFGHAAWFHGKRTPYTAQAEEDSLVWHLSRPDFDALKQADPGFAAWFERPPSVRLSEAAKVAGSPRRVAGLLRRAPVTVERRDSIRSTATRMRDERISPPVTRRTSLNPRSRLP